MKACRKCRAIQSDKSNPRCERCNSIDLTEDWSGIVVVIEPEMSEIAKKLGISEVGEFALKIR